MTPHSAPLFEKGFMDPLIRHGIYLLLQIYQGIQFRCREISLPQALNLVARFVKMSEDIIQFRYDQ